MNLARTGAKALWALGGMLLARSKMEETRRAEPPPDAEPEEEDRLPLFNHRVFSTLGALSILAGTVLLVRGILNCLR